MITADKNMPYQQNLSRRNFALIVLGANRWPRISRRTESIRTVLEEIRPGEVREVPILEMEEG